ncbi:TrkA C-terminal domain-containing protein [Anaerotignum sp.]|uniref:TrkA C-terminal domain-containing protein n=1 Tax=Anaerotignum sp. TaxID=2039241 RepID=UPI0028A8FB84|nr:TrkA C-terminal domain-containing protein [Anaerotignum sp.]
MEEHIEQSVSIPRYQQIAVELASRIVNEEYAEGQKIYARSAVASQYRVSPETARRAICVLCDLDIVTSEKGSGVTIKSKENARRFIDQYGKRETIETIKTSLMQSITRQKNEMKVLNSCLADLISATEHFRSTNPFMPFQIEITAECVHLNKNICEIQLWQHTGATAIAVKRGEKLMRSPGPYIALTEGDILFFITQDDSSQRVQTYLYS